MDREEIASHISSHTFFNIISNATRVIVTGIVLVYVARQLGPSQYGIVSLGLSIAIIIGLFYDFGVTGSTARFLAEADSSTSSIFENSRLLNLLFTFLFFFIVFILAKPIAILVNLDSYIYIEIICVITLFISLFRFSSRCLQGIKKTDKIALLNFLQALITNAFVFSIAYFGFKAKGVLVGHSASWAIIWVISLIILQKYFKICKMRVNFQILKRIFLYALPLLVTSSSYFLLLRGPSVLLSAFTSAKHVSYLNIPMKIIELISLPAYSLSLVAAPFFTRKEQTKGNLPWLYTKISKYFLIFYLPPAIFLALASKRFIDVIFGMEYANASNVLLVLSFYIPFFAITNFSGGTLDFMGLAKQKSIIFAITTSFAIGSAFFMIPRLKEIGAALVVAIPYTIFSVYTILASSIKCGVNLAKYSSKIAKFLLVVFLCCIPTAIILHNFAGLTGLILSFLCFVLFFFALGRITNTLKPKEITGVFKLLRQIEK